MRIAVLHPTREVMGTHLRVRFSYPPKRRMDFLKALPEHKFVCTYEMAKPSEHAHIADTCCAYDTTFVLHLITTRFGRPAEFDGPRDSCSKWPTMQT